MHVIFGISALVMLGRHDLDAGQGPQPRMAQVAAGRSRRASGGRSKPQLAQAEADSTAQLAQLAEVN